MDQTKGKNGSRLPRIIKTPSKILKAPLHICRPNRSQNFNADKRPSSIPRPKVSREMASTKIPEPSTTSKIQSSGERGNVQRVQLFISPEFGQEERTQTRSVASSRPIPTLGQIYGRVEMMDSDRVNEWLMTLNPPESLQETDLVHIQSNHEQDDLFVEEASSEDNTIRPADIDISTSSTTLNNTVCECLPPDIEHPTKDNESGYRSISPLSNNMINVKSKPSNESQLLNHSTVTYCLSGCYDPIVEKSDSPIEENTEKSDAYSVKEQPTVVINKVPLAQTINPDNIEEYNKNNLFLLKAKADSKTLKDNKGPFLSFVHCTSEIHQKTTNLEAEGCDSPKTLSSLAVTDLEIHDDFSSLYTLDHVDDSLTDHYHRNWFHRCDSSNVFKSQGSQATTTLNEFWKRENFDESTLFDGLDNNYRRSYYRYIYKGRYERRGDTRLRCRKSSSYKRFPSYRYHLTFPFASLRKRLSMQMCRRRWNRVWKKTAERWATLSRPVLKTKKSTDSAFQEQKPSAIATQRNMDCPNERCSKNIVDISAKDLNVCRSSKSRQANLGPSLFSFDNNSNSNTLEIRKPLPKRNDETLMIDENKKINASHNNVTPKTTASVQIEETNFIDSSNIIAICEVEMADNETEMDNTSLINKVTSTMHDMHFCFNKRASKDACTEMLMRFNIAETVSKTKHTCVTNSVGTFTSSTDITFCVMSSTKGIQVTPVPSNKDRNATSNETAKEIFKDRLPTFVTSLAFSRKVPKRVTSVQTPTNTCNLCCTVPKLISISSARIMTPSEDMVKKNYVHTEISAHPITVASGVCMTSPSLNTCTCNCRPDVSSCCTNTATCDLGKFVSQTEFEVFPAERLNVGKPGISTTTFTNINSMKLGSKTISQCTSGTQANISLKSGKTESYSQRIERIFENNEIESNCSTPIGRSRLINVYTMSGAASEAATQTSRRFKDMETFSSMVPKQTKSASVSSRLPVEPIKVPIDVATDGSTFESDRIVNCGCAEFGVDFGINTEIINPLNLECLTQTSASYLRKVNPTNEFTPANCTLACQRHLSEINQRLLSLTRLISQRKSNSQIYSNFHPITENALSSNLNAAKWLRRCASIEKGYPVALPTPSTLEDLTNSSVSASFYAKLPRELKKQLELLSSEYHSNKLHDVNYVLEAAPVVTLSRDSLADVLPSQKIPENPIDKDICDKGAKKDVTETIIQVSPEICDAAIVTDCALNYTTKSVYAVTSRIILPSPKSCCQCHNEYRKPCIESKIRTHGCFDSNVKLVVPGTPHHFSQRNEYSEVLSPRVYKALYEATRLVFKNGSEDQPYKNMITNSCAVGTDFIQTSKICSASVVTSELKSEQTKQDQCTSPDSVLESYIDKQVNDATQTSSNCRLQFIELPPGDQDILETHLVTSCRYYSNLLTKKLGRVRENFARHFPATAEDYICEIPGLVLAEACTMKPSGRGELGCQTHRRSNSKTRRHNSCFVLSPASSLTDICRHDKKHLKSVYYMLSSIEGRLRRLRTNLPVSSESFA